MNLIRVFLGVVSNFSARFRQVFRFHSGQERLSGAIKWSFIVDSRATILERFSGVSFCLVDCQVGQQHFLEFLDVLVLSSSSFRQQFKALRASLFLSSSSFWLIVVFVFFLLCFQIKFVGPRLFQLDLQRIPDLTTHYI